MKKLSGVLILLVVTTTLILQDFSMAAGGSLEQPVQVPEFTHTSPSEWINSAPLRTRDLEGKVVLIDFWTFGCWNCYRSFPWLNAMESRFENKGLQVIGVHTPEFAHEKIRKRIEQKVKEFELHHPVMIDSDSSYWRAMSNRYWPAYYILDKKGRIRAVFFGETHEGDRRARQIEKTIEQLLAEPT